MKKAAPFLALFGTRGKRLHAEQRAKESQKLLEAIVDNSPAIVWVKDTAGRYLLVNSGWEKMTGVERAGAVGKTSHEVLPSELADEFERLDREAFAGQSPISVEETVTLDEAEQTFVSLTFPLIDAQGDTFGIGGISTDITESKRLETAARENAELLTSAFQAAHAGMALILPEGRYLEVNDAFCNMTGYAREELLEMDWMSLTHPDDLAVNIPRSQDLLSGERNCHVYEKRFVHKDGRPVLCELSDAVVRHPDGTPKYFITHIHDVTEQRESAARLRQAEKMEAVGQLAGGIAHDFNNLLSVMLNYASFAAESLEPGHEAKQDLDEVVAAAKRASDLTRQLLAFTRQEPRSPKRVDLNESVTAISQMLRRSLPESLEIDLHLEQNLPAVRMDPSQLEQIIMNLAVNARDAMPGGGRLRIATETVTIDDIWASERPGIQPGMYTRLRVADTGAGMLPEIRDRAFEPFFTTKEMGQGTGLGLATVYGIVKGANGYVYISSDLGVGTVVSVYLPPVDGPASRDAIQLSLVDTNHYEEKTILVVEDEAAVRRLVHRMLGNKGFRVLTAASGAEALTLLSEQPQDIDLVLSDVVMPGMSGREFAARLRERSPQTPLLYMSGYTDDIVAVRGIIADHEHLLQKPFTTDKLLTAVLDLIYGDEGQPSPVMASP